MITLDTSALLALGNASDPDHHGCLRTIRTTPAPHIVPAGILGEVGYLLETRLGLPALRAFLSDLDGGVFTLDCGENDLPRIGELVQRYSDLPLGFADAAVVACAERNDGLVLTLDLRDFSVVSGEGTITVASETT